MMIQMNPNGVLANGRFSQEPHNKPTSRGSRRPTSDAVRISGGRTANRESSIGLNWASSMRVQKHEAHATASLSRMAKMLPLDEMRRPTPEQFDVPQSKVRLTDTAERLLLEGLDGSAKLAFQNAIDALYEQYADDLQLTSADVIKARESLLREAKSLLEDYAIKPWSPYDRETSRSLDDLGKQLEEKVLRHRQMVLEGSGDFSRALSELTVRAKSGDDADVIRLGDFVLRMSDALDARSTAQMRSEARLELLSGQTQLISDDALEMGRNFIEYLHSLRA